MKKTKVGKKEPNFREINKKNTLKMCQIFKLEFSGTYKKEKKVTNNHSFKLDHKLFLKEFQVT